MIFLGALLVKKITGYKFRKTFFIIELPEYKIPSLKRATLSMLSRGKAYIVKAGTIILVCNTAVQIMQSFNWQFQVVEEGMEHTSILASIASPFAVLLIPLGFGVWQLAAAAITGFIAKENVVGTLAVVYGLTNFIDTDELALVGGANEVAMVMGLTKVAALAYLMFNLFTPPCFAALGAMNSEMQDKRWLWGGIALQLATGYTVAFFVYQVGTLITTGTLGNGFVPGLIAVAAFAGAVAAGVLASALKRMVGYPRISITVPSIVIMVPGLYLYKAVYNLGNMDLSAASSWFASALLIIFALPLGLIFARILTDKTFRYCT